MSVGEVDVTVGSELVEGVGVGVGLAATGSDVRVGFEVGVLREDAGGFAGPYCSREVDAPATRGWF